MRESVVTLGAVAALDADDPASVVTTFFTSQDPAQLCGLMTPGYREGAATLDFESAGIQDGDPVGACEETVRQSLAHREGEGTVNLAVTKAEIHGVVAEVWAQGDGGHPFILVHLELGDGGWHISEVMME